MDLHLPLGPGPMRAQLEQRLREGVRAGRLPAGTALPSSRALAAELGVSRGVVVEAYAQLTAEGWLVARHGAGTRIAATTPGALVGFEDRSGEEPSIRRDLRTGRPDLAAFPRRAWAGAVTRALREAPDAALDYGDPRGTRQQRQALTAHLGRARGVVATPARVIVCAGTAAGLPLVLRALHERFALSGIAAGLHVVAQTSEAAELATRARREGVAVHTLHGDCFVAASRPPALLLGYARETEPSLTRAARLLTAPS